MVDMVAAYREVSPKNSEDIIDEYAVLVKRIAHHLKGRLPKSVQIDDLIQAGMIGLLESHRNFDASKGASFATYASIRIRGAMLDEVRKNDWLPRSVYRNSRMISDAIRKVENFHGRDAKDSEIAKELGCDLPDYHRLVRDVSMGQLYGFEDVGVTDDLMSHGIAAEIEDPLSSVQRTDFQKNLSRVISTLSERDQMILSLYYNDELNLKEIGEILEVSESRVCQIHSQAMLKIRARLGE